MTLSSKIIGFITASFLAIFYALKWFIADQFKEAENEENALKKKNKDGIKPNDFFLEFKEKTSKDYITSVLGNLKTFCGLEVNMTAKENELIYGLRGNFEFLLQQASVAGLVKETTVEGEKMPFSLPLRNQFENVDNEAKFFTTSERIALIFACVKKHRLVPDNKKKNPAIRLYPAHNSVELAKFSKTWVFQTFKKQPLDDVKNYFGEEIGFYFTFLETYTTALIFPSVFGVVVFFFNTKKG